MTTPDLAALRVRVAEAMGWTRVWAPHTTTAPIGWRSPDGDESPLPNFASPDWAATGAVLDEMTKRGMAYTLYDSISDGWWCSVVGLPCPEHESGWGPVKGDDPRSPHVAVCLAFVAAHDRAKEQA